MPITDAELVRQREPEFARVLPVVIMNVRYVSRIHLVDGAPEPPPSTEATPALADRVAELGVQTKASLSPSMPNMAAAPIPPRPEPTATPPVMPPDAAEPFRFSDIEPVAGSVHHALSELAALRRDGLVSDAEFDSKRAEILSRL